MISYEGNKVTTASAMAAMEQKALKEGDATGDEYMQRAANAIFEIASQHAGVQSVTLLCGKGNNGGDSYCVGELFLARKAKVTAYQMFPLKECSELCQKHASAFQKSGGEVVFVSSLDDISLPENSLIIDGLLGTGFQGKVEGLLSEVIEKVNQSPNYVIAIDIPSGVSGNDGIVKGSAIKADLTVALGLTKLGHFYNDGYNHVGEIEEVSFGISKTYIDALEPEAYLVNKEALGANFPRHLRKANKYTIGKVGIVGGSPDMPGAAILAATSALRSGAGMVQLFHPANMGAALSALPLEIIRAEFRAGEIKRLEEELPRIKALLVGPGLGRSESIPGVLNEIYKKVTQPLVIDADALFFFKGGIRKPAILTPHRGELCRLLNLDPSLSDLKLLDIAEEFARRENVVIVCKGAPTTIVFPSRKRIIIPYGNEGMASGGSGDVLAGIIASIAAQGKGVEEAAILGTMIHGLAGDLAKEKKSLQSMIASDIIKALPEIFQQYVH